MTQKIEPAVLETELKTYADHRDELLAQEGRFVLIHGNQIVGAYDSQADAVTQGYKQFGNVPFLVKQIMRIEKTVTFYTRFG